MLNRAKRPIWADAVEAVAGFALPWWFTGSAYLEYAKDVPISCIVLTARIAGGGLRPVRATTLAGMDLAVAASEKLVIRWDCQPEQDLSPATPPTASQFTGFGQSRLSSRSRPHVEGVTAVL